jgi:cell wall-associated NlpC family hydrolase
MEYKDLIGIPFKKGGRDRTGLDCYGLVVEFYRRMGVLIEDPPQYRYSGPKGEPIDLAAYTGGWRETEEPFQEGDVLLFEHGLFRSCMHCAIFLAGDRILHATDTCGVVTSPIRHYLDKITKAYRWNRAK